VKILRLFKKQPTDPIAEHLKRWRSERPPLSGGPSKSVRDLGIEDNVYLPGSYREPGDDGGGRGKRLGRAASKRWRER